MLKKFRHRYLSRPIFNRIKALLPPISETERQALDAGDTWWDAEILSGKPDWDVLDEVGIPQFDAREQAFMDGPLLELCAMIDDWDITFKHRDIPDTIWAFLKEKRFFGIIIPEQYGGLGFSAYAHSEIVTRLSIYSTTVAVTVMVPNSLGPGELLLLYGSDQQKNHYLPRLATGKEIPCFGLTSTEAGSDAAAMTDTGIVCYQDSGGQRQLGIRLNWHKRYITLGPVATLMGLAIKLFDPDHILGDETDLGITVALVDTRAEGIEIGRRHYPAFQAFQNGPNEGRDVFVPMDAVIGGQEQIGNGWKMLMTALAAGRSISLPSLSAGGVKLAARTTGAYARIREQFGIPVGKFEGVQVCLANIAAQAYLLDAARVTTTLAIDRGSHPAVISAILKSQATYKLRDVINDAMDVHGGKTVCDGPSNYLGNMYRAVPVAITVEGANILTRNLIVFGQGAVRCHPYLLDEILAAEDENSQRGLEKFDRVFYKHLGFAMMTFLRAWWHNLTAGRFAARSRTSGLVPQHYRSLSRYAASLTHVTEVALLTLGGALKRKEMLSARLGDVLSEVYLLSCVLHRFTVDGQPEKDLPLVDWLMQSGCYKIQQSLAQVMDNFPNRVLALLMRLTIFPWGKRQRPPDDELTRLCAELLLVQSDTRERICRGTAPAQKDSIVAKLDLAFSLVQDCEPLQKKLRESKLDSITVALARGVLTREEANLLEKSQSVIAEVIAVDDFSPEEISGQKQIHPVIKSANDIQQQSVSRRPSSKSTETKVVEMSS